MDQISFIVLLGLGALLFVALPVMIGFYQQTKIKEQIHSLADSSIEMTPEEFFKMRNFKHGRSNLSTHYDFPGVYILYNYSRRKPYIGQSVKVLRRVNQHFTGKGNGDVYADYKYGSRFTIRTIKFDENCPFRSLNELEKNTIMTYASYRNGYNKTRGNG